MVVLGIQEVWDEHVLKLIVAMAAQPCDSIKNH